MDAHLRPLAFLFAAACATGAAAQTQRTPDAALRALQDGNQRHVAGAPAPKATGPGVRRTQARGTSPLAVVVACADSTTPPELVFDADLGDLVVVRTAGHACSAELVAAIESACVEQAVPLCVVLAHDGCATLAAALAQAAGAPANAAGGAAHHRLLARCEPALRALAQSPATGAARVRLAEEEHAQATAQTILQTSELLRERAGRGAFRVVAARCRLADGVVDWLPTRPLPPTSEAAAAAVKQAPPNAPPQLALRTLQAGHRRFLGDGQPTGDASAARREQLAHGAQPFAVVFACTDARVAPERLFDAGLGELAVVRLPGAAVTDDALAAAEQAIAAHGTALLVVLGHTQCGALRAAAAGPGDASLTPSQRALQQRLEPAVAAARHDARGRDVVDLAARHQTLRAMAEARGRSELVRRAARDGRLLLVGAVYDVTTGDVEWLADEAPTAAAPAAPVDDHATHGHATTPAAPAAAHAGHGEHDDHGGHTAPAAQHDAHDHAPATKPGDHDDHAAHAASDAHHALPVVDWDHVPSAPHGETATPAAGGAHPSAVAATPWWLQPATLVGALGVLTLLAAALLLRRR